MNHPLVALVDELTKQAVMRFRNEDIARVQRVCRKATRELNIDIECPLPVWDSQNMGVAFRRVSSEMVGGKRRQMKRTATFVLDQSEMEDEDAIGRKATIAIDAITFEIMSQAREMKDGRPETANVHDNAG